MKFEYVKIHKSDLDDPEYDFQYYLFKLAQKIYRDKSLLSMYNSFVPFLDGNKWVICFGTEEELKQNDPNDWFYKMEWLTNVGHSNEFNDINEEMWYETAEYISDYINPIIYKDDEEYIDIDE